MALKYPHVQFAIVDFAYDPPLMNIVGLTFAEDQSGFLAGALAGLMTQTRSVGMVAGVEIPPVIRFRKGYEAGVKYVCPCQPWACTLTVLRIRPRENGGAVAD
jgi:basic membrane lipoprotein Med (substrate-binding protein (PBP1-ABC) superfamily)